MRTARGRCATTATASSDIGTTSQCRVNRAIYYCCRIVATAVCPVAYLPDSHEALRIQVSSLDILNLRCGFFLIKLKPKYTERGAVRLLDCLSSQAIQLAPGLQIPSSSGPSTTTYLCWPDGMEHTASKDEGHA